MPHSPLTQQLWFRQLIHSHQELISQSFFLLEREQRLKGNLADYSFVIFPCAKAYEGFLKWYLWRLKYIDDETYYGRKFRIGRSLNPDLPKRLQNGDWLYDELAKHCGEVLIRQMWDAWIQCRNHVFHFYPNQQNHLTLSVVEKKLQLMTQVMERLVLCME